MRTVGWISSPSLRAILSAAVIPQLKLRHLHWRVSVPCVEYSRCIVTCISTISINTGTESMLYCSSCVYSAIILSQLSPAVRCVLRVLLTRRAVETTLLRSKFLHFTVTCISETMGCRTRCVTFSTYFVTRNHTVESLCANFFSSCVCVCVCACVRTYLQNVPRQVCRDSG